MLKYNIITLLIHLLMIVHNIDINWALVVMLRQHFGTVYFLLFINLLIIFLIGHWGYENSGGKNAFYSFQTQTVQNPEINSQWNPRKTANPHI